jgi:hypothetical protein
MVVDRLMDISIGDELKWKGKRRMAMEIGR